jgi:hypothetical protein
MGGQGGNLEKEIGGQISGLARFRYFTSHPDDVPWGIASMKASTAWI